MRYWSDKGVVGKIKKFQTKFINLTTAVILAATSLAGATPLLLSQKALALGLDHVVINEISSHSSSDWVELYNPTGATVNLVNYSLADAAGNTKDSSKFSATTISSNGFVIVDFGKSLDKKGDTVTLSNGTNTIDTVSYGTSFTSGDEGTADAPGNNSKTVSRTWDAGIAWAVQGKTKGTSNGSAPTAVVNAENFNTVNYSGYKGINVGLDYHNFNTISKVTVSLYKGLSPLVTNISNSTLITNANTHALGFYPALSTPFIIQDGTYHEDYWHLGVHKWTKSDQPTEAVVTVEGTDLSGRPTSQTAYNFNLTGASDWDNLFPPATPNAPTNMHFVQGLNTYACGEATNSKGGISLAWTAPSGNFYQYTITPSYPDNHGEYAYYPSGLATSVWIGDNFGNHGEGTYTYNIKAENTAGQWSSIATCSLIYDVTQPVIHILSPTPNSYVRGTVTVQAEIVENGSGLKYVNAKFTDGPTADKEFGSVNLTLVPGTTDIYKGQINTAGHTGAYNVTVNTADNANNTRSAKNQNITIDNTAPTIAFVEPGTDGTHNNGTLNVKVHATDNIGLKQVTVHLYDDTNTLLSSGCTSVTGNLGPAYDYTCSINTKSFKDGQYTLLAASEDNTNKVTTTSRTVTFDNHAPTVSVTSPTTGEVIGGLGNNYKVTVKLKIDDLTGVDTNPKYTWVEFYNGSAVNGSVSNHSKKYELHQVGNTDVYTATIDTTDFVAALHNSGTYSLQVRAKDTLGNASSHDYYYGGRHGVKLLVDNSRGSVQISLPANGTIVSNIKDIDISGTATDHEGLIDHVDIVVDQVDANGNFLSQPIKATTVNYNPSTHEFTFTIPKGTLADGDHYAIKAIAYDQVGNAAYAGSTVTIDNIYPTASLKSPAPGTHVKGNVDFKFDVNDLNGIKKVYYNIQGANGANMSINGTKTFWMTQNADGTWSFPSDIDTTQLLDGTYTFNLRATDNALNTKYIRPLGPIVVDNTAPKVTSVTVSPLYNGNVVSGNTKITVTLDEVTSLASSGNWVHFVRANHGDGNDFTSPNYALAPTGNPNEYYAIVPTKDFANNKLLDDVRVYIRTQDSLGNKTAVYYKADANGDYDASGSLFYLTIDNAVPAVPTSLSWLDSNGNPATNGFTNVQKGTLSWQDSDASVDHYVYKFWTNISGYYDGEANAWTTDEARYFNGASIWTNFDNKEGTYYFCVEAVDAVGNTSACSSTYVVTYDSTAPVLTINPNNVAVDTTPTAITGTTDDNTADVTVNVDGQNYTVPVKDLTSNSNGTWDWSITTSNALTIGTYTVTATSTDIALNTGTATYKLVVNPVLGAYTNKPNTQDLQKTGTPGKGAGNGLQTTGTNGSDTSNPQGDNSGTSGKELGDKTNQSNSTNTGNNKKNDDNTKSSNFLGLGWWWIPLLIVIIAILYSMLRKADTDDKKA